MKSNLIWALVLFLVGCGGTSTSSDETNQSQTGTSNEVAPIENKPENYNISILLDLSDRIAEQPDKPSQKERDLAIVSTVVEVFKQRMKQRGAYLAKDKIRVVFSPAPNDPNVNNIARALSVDLSGMDNASKKKVFDSIQDDFKNSLSEIYDLTLQNSRWLGSDIWRFFKYDVDLCLEDDPSYKDILVIVSDGYLYHQQSEGAKNPGHAKQTAFITPNFLKREGFWNNPNWRKKFEDEGYGLIAHDRIFEDLSVLVLEVNPSPNHKDDQDIIRTYLVQWFGEMGITSPSLAIYDTDLPVNTKRRVEMFFK